MHNVSPIRKYCPLVARNVTRLNLIRIMLVVNVRPPLERAIVFFFFYIDSIYERETVGKMADFPIVFSPPDVNYPDAIYI